LGLQHHLDHQCGTERAVQLVDCSRDDGDDGDSDAQVFAAAAFQLDGAGVKRRVELVCDMGDGCDQTIAPEPTSAMELRQVLDQVFRRNGRW
jgi:hypothetical protein